MGVTEEIERRWQTLPKWRRCRLRIKQVVPDQRLWVRALYVLSCEGDKKAQAAMRSLFETTRLGQIVPRRGLKAPQQQRQVLPVALASFIGDKTWKE